MFGGLNNMVDGLAKPTSLQSEDDRGFTTCMAEVIGDDRTPSSRPPRQRAPFRKSSTFPFAHTPAFVGSHVDRLRQHAQGRVRALLGRARPRRAGKTDQHHRRLRRLRRRQQPRMKRSSTPWRGLHDPVRTRRPVGHARRRRVPHVRRRNEDRRCRGRAQRQGPVASVLVHQEDRWTMSPSRPGGRDASITRWASARPTLLMKISELRARRSRRKSRRSAAA